MSHFVCRHCGGYISGEYAGLHNEVCPGRNVGSLPRAQAQGRPTKPCRSCQSPMIWVTTSTGKKMPLDAVPDPDGTFFIREEQDGDLYGYNVRTPDPEPQDELRYTSHFATCPNADQHRSDR